MTEHDGQGRDALLADVLAGDAPDGELMARYARDPASLDEAERAEVEAHLEGSPGARDALQVLKSFRVPPRPAAGLGAAPRRTRRLLPAAAALAAAAVVIVVFNLPRPTPPEVAYARPAEASPRPAGTIAGRGETAIALSALAPDHVGLTARAAPGLLYFLAPLPSDDWRLRFELRAEGDPPERAIALPLALPERAGVQQLQLGELGVELERERVYVWSLSLTAPGASDAGLVARGFVRRIEAPPTATAKAGLGSGERSVLLAERGLWYDAAEAASELEDRRLLEDLLLQAGAPRLPAP